MNDRAEAIHDEYVHLSLLNKGLQWSTSTNTNWYDTSTFTRYIPCEVLPLVLSATRLWAHWPLSSAAWIGDIITCSYIISHTLHGACSTSMVQNRLVTCVYRHDLPTLLKKCGLGHVFVVQCNWSLFCAMIYVMPSVLISLWPSTLFESQEWWALAPISPVSLKSCNYP